MSVIHINQIARKIRESVYDHIDVSDILKQSPENLEQMRMSRSLAAFTLVKVADADIETASAAVTDGSRDNGIDAIYISEEDGPVLYLVQAKWSDKGASGASLDDMIKFRRGIEDIIEGRWDRFNDRICGHKEDILDILEDPSVRIRGIYACMGAPEFSEDVTDELADYFETLNDPTEVAEPIFLNQGKIHRLLVDENLPEDIDITVNLSDWGKYEGEHVAYYGHVSAADPASWLKEHGSALFSKNVREVINESEVNERVYDSLTEDPKSFWYLNNGITALCDAVRKAPRGGSDRRSGTFEFSGVSIVNGAQTTGTLNKALEKGVTDALGDARVTVRFISLEGANEDFGKLVTRATNTQNRIGGRDFVGLDPVQVKLAEDFAVDGLKYSVRNGEEMPVGPEGCDFTEAAIALACADSARLATQAKREVSKLWDDTSRAPYKKLFNPNTRHTDVWEKVQILRVVDETLATLSPKPKNRLSGYATHGNRLIAHLVISQGLSVAGIGDGFDDVLSTAADLTGEFLDAVFSIGEAEYGGYTASLFKNVKKCEHIALMAKNGHLSS